QRHIIRLDQSISFLCNMANLVYCHIAALIHKQGGHENDLAVRDYLVNLFEESSTLFAWNTAHTIAFNDDRIVVFSNPWQQSWVHAWNQFQQENLWIEVDVERRIGTRTAFLHVVNDAIVANGRQYWEIDAVKGI